ncbi:hypothetical protein E2562_026701 [Oryza meyeriana var. granulata]|uniref:Uncharacterized protein n=1 Tax=Oryza meyeriana var. granulata TaxID=110450 RepID=A0A6G1E2S5_9ORYZ|nr:hypothetical protein E2562_026701 [Oryza meyeriana var. granulata]
MPPPVACIPVVEKPSPRAPQSPPVKPFYPVDMTTTTMVEIPSWPAQPPAAGPVSYTHLYPVDMTTTTMVEIPSWPARPPAVGPCGGSCCAPCYQGCYEGCRCGSCGRVYGYSVPSARPPSLLPPPCYGGGATMSTPYCGGYSGCRLVNEEDPTACTIM